MSNVAVFGLGYVGCVTAACLASLGHRVTGIDKDSHKVAAITEGRSPFFEPGLDELISQNVAARRLQATLAADEAVRDADVAFVCVGTPSERNGNISLASLKAVCAEIRLALNARTSSARLVVAIRSTIFPGTCDDVVMPIFDGQDVSVIVHPEFMREGSAIADFQRPPLLVFGGSERDVLERVAALYDALTLEPSFVAIRTAEIIKYACNAFHAVKIGFANEIGTLAAALDIDGVEVMSTVCRDTTLNISSAYLRPGMSFGGSCLPKDLRALVYRARHQNLRLDLLESILPSNDEHLRRAVQAVLDIPAERRIGVFGLAFKENTDDLRESPVVTLLEQLVGKGRDVRVFDPHIHLDQIYGSNRNFIVSALPHVARLMEYDLERLLEWADDVVVAQKPARSLLDRIRSSGRHVIDLTDVQPPSKS